MDSNLKNVRLTLTFFKLSLSSSLFLFPKCARTDQELFLSRIELISFLSLFYNYFVAK